MQTKTNSGETMRVRSLSEFATPSAFLNLCVTSAGLRRVGVRRGRKAGAAARGASGSPADFGDFSDSGDEESNEDDSNDEDDFSLEIVSGKRFSSTR